LTNWRTFFIVCPVKLRDHPQMSYRGLANWPPIWTQVNEQAVKTLWGEVGVLENVSVNERIHNKCYLLIRHEGERYVGCLAFSDVAFCQAIVGFLQHQLGHQICHIGDLDVSHTL
jgi:hypothetical protein